MTDDPRLGLPSASSFWLDVACPGRRNLLQQMQREGVPIIEDPQLAEWAASGRKIHKAREVENTLELNEREAEIYKKGVEGERRIVQLWEQDNELYTILEGPAEERFWIHHPLTLEPLASAQIDRHYLAPPHLLIIDWKSFFAPWVPPSNRNWQLRLCALAAIAEYDDITKVRVAINKPMAFGEKIDYTDLTLYDLKRIEESALSICWASSQPDAPLYPGPHCFRCPCNSACPAAASYASMPVMTQKPDPLAMVALMSTADLAKVWRVRPQLKAIMTNIEERLATLSDEELRSVGLKRTRGRKLDKITSTRAAVLWLAQELRLEQEQIYTAMEFKGGELVQLVMAQKSFTEQQAKDWIDTKLDEFISRDRAKPSIVTA